MPAPLGALMLAFGSGSKAIDAVSTIKWYGLLPKRGSTEESRLLPEADTATFNDLFLFPYFFETFFYGVHLGADCLLLLL